MAAIPALDHFHPPAASPGTTNVVTAIGKIDPWPPHVWVDDPGIRFQATTNKGQFMAEIAATAAAGPHLVRFYNADGASRPRCFVVDSVRQVREVEPNDEFKSPQSLEALPAVLNGRLDKSGDVDSYAVSLAAGQTLVASVEAYLLESPVDAVLRVLDARGVQQAWNHDGRALDPFLPFTAPVAGRYVVQVFGFPYPATSEIRFYGNEKAVYRLHLNAGPYGRHTLPLGARRDGNTRLRLAGWNLPPSEDLEAEFSPEAMEESAPFAALRRTWLENTVWIPVGAGMETMEREPNDSTNAANDLVIPGAATGCLDSGDDTDRYRFTAKKGERLQWTVQSAKLGFPVDAWLRIENSNGTQVARSEGANGQDPDLSWTPGGSGTFYAAVGSLVHRGGSNYWYRLNAERPGPDYKASVGEHSFVFKPGTTNDVKATVTRSDGHKQPLTVRIDGLPEGVVSAPAEVSEKGGDVTLKVMVSTNAVAFSGPIRVVTTAEAKERAAVFSFVESSENNGVPGGYRDLLAPSTESLWLTVKVEKTEKTEPKESSATKK